MAAEGRDATSSTCGPEEHDAELSVRREEDEGKLHHGKGILTSLARNAGGTSTTPKASPSGRTVRREHLLRDTRQTKSGNNPDERFDSKGLY